MARGRYDMISGLHIAAKDLREEMRTKQMLNSMIVFSLLVIVIFSIAFEDIISSSNMVSMIAPGALWITFIFAGSLGLSRSFAAELENGCLEGLKLCPVERSEIYIGKVIAGIVLMFFVELVTVPIFSVLFNYPIDGLFSLMVIIVLGTIGFVVVGTLLSALTVNTRTREVLLPVLLLPLVIPVIIPSVLATARVLTGGGIVDVLQEIRLLVVYDVVFFIVAYLVFEHILQD